MSETASGTATTAGAREHARAQEAQAAQTPERWNMPVLPASAADAREGVPAESMRWAERVAGGNYTHKVLAPGTELRLTDIAGDACASVLIYNALETHERLNVADTLKVQWQVYSGRGQVLFSDQGRAMATLTEDTSGRHDGLYGTSSQLRNEQRYGDGSPEGPSPAGRELFALAAAKHGLGRRDIPPNLSFFQGVEIDDAGTPQFLGSAGAGAHVTLRLEMPTIVLIANTAHPLDPRPEYSCGPLDVHAWAAAPTDPSDELWSRTPEGRRAFENTADYLTARGIR